jgi:RNA polymerase sigma-70 factor, ECF subfamily
MVEEPTAPQPATDPSDGPEIRCMVRSFEQFYLNEFRGVVALTYALTGSRVAAEDIAQEAFLAAHRQWERISGYEHQGAWVRRVAANLAVSSIRRSRSEARALLRLQRQPAPALDPLPDDSADFWRAVRRLPKRQAQVVALHYLEDLSVRQIATVLNCAEGTVKVLLHRGRRTLAHRLNLLVEEP